MYRIQIYGLGDVHTTGGQVFQGATNLKSVDLVPSKIIALGDYACMVSNIEDILDFSPVPDSAVGKMALRRVRWDESGLAAVRNVESSRSYLLTVPNPDRQRNYPNVLYCTVNGEEKMAAGNACQSVALYHVWQEHYAENDAMRCENWQKWWEKYYNTDGSGYATVNRTSIPQMRDMVADISQYGWTYDEEIVVDEKQLSTILDRLDRGLPTNCARYVSDSTRHDSTIVGWDSTTRKLAILDPDGAPKVGSVSFWVAYEDLFVQGYGVSGREDFLEMVSCDL